MCKIFFKTSNYHLLLKWSIISLLLSFLIGISSAVFLIGLDCVTQMRVNHTWLILLLPLGGLLIGIVYKSAGQNINKGNNLIIETIQTSGAIIPVKIVPIIFFPH